ncbi:MAG: acyl--CoA ligase [Burkholderiaceae bacterium]|nr:acyl--CoA ligase [Burkholderiaceae bacterium]
MPNISDILTDSANRAPESAALLHGGVTLSHRDLDAQVWRAAAWLLRQGVARGEVVASSCRSELSSFVIAMALARIGASALTLSLAEPRTLRVATARRCAARRLVTDTREADDAGLEPMLIASGQFEGGAPVPDPGVRDDDPLAPWLVIIGSGSTGAPKRIDLSHRASFERNEKYRRALGLGSSDRGLCAAPFDFTATKQRFIEILSAGGSMAFWDRDRHDLIGACAADGVSVLHANVIYLERLLETIGPDASNVLAGLRVLRVSASTVPPKLRERLVRQLTPNTYVVYGTNEFGIVSLADPREAIEYPQSVGKAVEGVSVEVVDPRGRVLPVGAVGLVRIRGPGMVERYVGDELASARAFREGWFYPGDLAALTGSGSILFRGRADQMMILDGINIYPAEIEQAMLEHPAIADAAAVPISSSVHQDIPVCAVSLREGAHAGEAELMEFARERLGVRRPRRIVVVPRIPRSTAQGKLQRDELMQLLGAALGIPARITPRG